MMSIRPAVHGHVTRLQSTIATPIARQQKKRKCNDPFQRVGRGGERARTTTVVVVAAAVLMLSCAHDLPSAAAVHVVGKSIGHGSSCASAAAGEAEGAVQRLLAVGYRNVPEDFHFVKNSKLLGNTGE